VSKYIANFLMAIGLEDKNKPGSVSATRTLGLIWGLTAVALGFILVLSGSAEYLIVAEFIAGAAGALAFRSKWFK
jgi:hypothetical protein